MWVMLYECSRTSCKVFHLSSHYCSYHFTYFLLFFLQFPCPHTYFVCCTLLSVQLPCSSRPLSPCRPEAALVCYLLWVYVRPPATGFLWSAHCTSLGITCYHHVSSCLWYVISALYTEHSRNQYFIKMSGYNLKVARSLRCSLL